LVQAASQHVQHMHKALTQMNLQIHHVISDITGATGLAIVDAILDGQRDAVELAKLRNSRIKADEETIRKSLVGNWRLEHLFSSDNHVSCIGYISNGSWTVIWRLKNCCLPSSNVLIQRKSLCRRTENGIGL
jgi:hypothetical protein